MLKERAAILSKINVALDLCLTALSFILAHYLRGVLKASPVLPVAPLLNNLWLLYIILPLWGFLFHYNGVYQSQRLETIFQSCWRITRAIFCGSLVLAAIVFLFKVQATSRTLLILFLVINELLLVTERIVLKYTFQMIRRKGYNYRNILVVGTGKRAQKFMKMIQGHKEWGLKVIGCIDQEPSMVGKSICGIQVIDVLENLPDVLHNSEIDEVVFIVPLSWLNFLEKYILACEEMGIKARLAGDFFAHKIAKTHLQELNGQSFLTFDPTPHKEGTVLVKRALDIVLSCLILAFIWPLLLLIAASIKFTSEGHILYRQIRCGQNGKRFAVLKFRTMINEAENLKSRVEHMNEMSGPVFKIKNDPRVTKVGRILRRASLDELPQLINVLKGDMSLVGPRPPLPDEVKKYVRWQRRRLSMKPGITCLWQVNGRNKIDFEKWMRLDLEYIDNWSLTLDMQILLKTIPAVLRGTGA